MSPTFGFHICFGKVLGAKEVNSTIWNILVGAWYMPLMCLLIIILHMSLKDALLQSLYLVATKLQYTRAQDYFSVVTDDVQMVISRCCTM